MTDKQDRQGAPAGPDAPQAPGTAATTAAVRPADGVTEGGDPVCWLEQVCDECGAMREDRTATACRRCGTPFPTPGGGA